jgi:hypothetical protein
MVSGPVSRPTSPSFLRSRRIRSRTSTGSALGEAALGRRGRGSKATLITRTDASTMTTSGPATTSPRRVADQENVMISRLRGNRPRCRSRERCPPARGAGEPDGCVLAPGVGVVQQLTPARPGSLCRSRSHNAIRSGVRTRSVTLVVAACPAHDPLGEHVDDESDVDEPAQVLQ